MRVLAFLVLLPMLFFACTVYFEGIGCPHCAKVDRFFFRDGNLKDVLIEYEVYVERENAVLLQQLCDKYNITFCGVPALFVGDTAVLGDRPIINSYSSLGSNICGPFGSFQELDFNKLPGKPKVIFGDRAVIKGSELINSSLVRAFLYTNYTPKEFEEGNYVIQTSGWDLKFNRKADVNGWIFLWREEDNVSAPASIVTSSSNFDGGDPVPIEKLIGLAVADSVNPCAMAVLLLFLLGLAAANFENKNALLLGGSLFILAIFIGYFIYGILLVYFFQLIQLLVSIRLFLYHLLAFFALILAILQLRDYFFYEPGHFLTEMPLWLRPKVKELLTKATSPLAALPLGIFVTLFLLPCTIGPYIVMTGLLSQHFSIFASFPYLLVYNVIFVLPMVIIVGAVYLGISRIEDIQAWKNKHIRQLHLLAGLLLLAISILMLMDLL